ncbi:MAG: phage holin family protein [Bacilli bacterium]|nr:phage holin family protein [Bacilli bacterium]
MRILKDKDRVNKLIEWSLYMVGYIIVFIFVTSFFDSIYIDSKHLIFYSTLIVLIVHILNITVKPILVSLTIPITGLTLGLFYPFINLFILKIADILLGEHFQLHNIYILIIVVVLLSISNLVMEGIMNKIIKKVRKNG